MISAVAWIPKGVASMTPDKAVVSPEELAAMRGDKVRREGRGGPGRAGVGTPRGVQGSMRQDPETDALRHTQTACHGSEQGAPGLPNPLAAPWAPHRLQDASTSGSEPESEWESEEDSDMDEAAEVAKAKAMAASLRATGGAAAASDHSGHPGDDALAAAMAELDMERYDDDEEGDSGAEGTTAARLMGSSGNPGASCSWGDGGS